jgi:OmpA-OmpF porin, OOP family
MKKRRLFLLSAGAWLLCLRPPSSPETLAGTTEHPTEISDSCVPRIFEGRRFLRSREDSATLVTFLKLGGRDTDGDGVRDRRDACPETPVPAVVDERGCPTDTDEDGVLDGIDQCAQTPPRAAVDANGCPYDSDRDRILDGLDLCPDTDPAALVDADGCPYDSDHDGVLEGIDRCPDTPIGAVVDARGCQVDSEGDGVPDGLDDCPDTSLEDPSDESGCSGAQRGEFVLPTIRFEPGRWNLTEACSTLLNEVASVLRQSPDTIVEIGGHTDNEGPASVNRTISLNRAEEVKAYLITQGVSASRLITKGYGEVHPIASNRTAEGRAKNRRIEFNVLPR